MGSSPPSPCSGSPSWLPVACCAGLAASGIALLALCVGIAVWQLGWLGGGDVKLIAALSLWAGPSHLAGLLLAIALGGGVLALAITVAGHPAVAAMAIDLEGAPASCCRRGWRCRSRTGRRPARPPMAVAEPPFPTASPSPVGGAWLLYRLFLA